MIRVMKSRATLSVDESAKTGSERTCIHARIAKKKSGLRKRCDRDEERVRKGSKRMTGRLSSKGCRVCSLSSPFSLLSHNNNPHAYEILVSSSLPQICRLFLSLVFSFEFFRRNQPPISSQSLIDAIPRAHRQFLSFFSVSGSHFRCIL